MSEGAWPDSLFAAPILRGLDPAGRRAVESAGALRKVRAGEEVFRAESLGDGFFVVDRGEVELRGAARSSIDEPKLLRVVRAGETFGEESTLPGARRQSTAIARVDTQMAEIPAALFRRALGRSGADAREAPQHRLLRRRATADLLRRISLAEDLPEADFELLLDAASHRELARGDRIYGVGDRPDGLWLIAHGLVQLQTEDREGGVAVRAYLSDGDFFGDAELLDEQPRALSAVAMGACHLLFVERAAFRSLVDRNPRLVPRLRRISQQRSDRQAAAVEAAPNSTRHVFADLYRLQMARSLLTIDQDACVRCGHCAWSCEQVHGVARLVRRGDKVVTQLAVLDGRGGAARELLLPNSCQHCKNPVCMIDCPTGAIGRDPEGEVFIRESLCTGCGNCAKACPWENIRMGPRPLDLRRGLDEQFAPSLVAAAGRRELPLDAMYPEVATKCDLCREYAAPACVQACPTEAIIRLEPERDFAEVSALLDLMPTSGGDAGASPSRARALRPGPVVLAMAAVLGLALVVAALGLHARELLHPGRGLGLAGGIAAAIVMVLLVAHAVPKRLIRILWMRPRPRLRGARAALGESQPEPLPRSRVRPFYLLHLGLGLTLPGLVLAHAGTSIAPGGAGVLSVLAWATILLGAFGGASHALIPRRLTRLEHAGALPEDLADERERLLADLQRELSGKSSLLKGLTAGILLPWARAPLGGLAMLLSGRDLAATRAMLRARIEAALPQELREGGSHPGERREQLAGLDAVLRTCVELRALPTRRVLSAMLRGWHAPHVLLTGALLLALLAHVVTVMA